MKKFFLIVLILLASCGYQPIYLNKNFKNLEFNKITSEGEENINMQIINSLSFKESQYDLSLNSLELNSSFKITETSKNSKGQVESYRSKIIVNLIIKNREDIITDKVFEEQFDYNNKDNKFELVRYQNEVKNNLINKIVEDIFLHINL